MARKFGFSFSWKRALGLSAAKGKISRAIGIPLTQSGRQRKAGRLLGDLAGTALTAGAQFVTRNEPSNESPVAAVVQFGQIRQDYRYLIRAIRLGDHVDSVSEMVPGLRIKLEDDRTGELILTDDHGLHICSYRGDVYLVSISFAWSATLRELADEVKIHLEIPSDAAWEMLDAETKSMAGQAETSECGGWSFGDKGIILTVDTGIGVVTTSLPSLGQELARHQDALGVFDPVGTGDCTVRRR